MDESVKNLEIKTYDENASKRWIVPVIAASLIGYAIGIGVGYSICKDTVKNAFTIGIF